MATKSKVEAEMMVVSPTRAARWLKERQYIVEGELRQRQLRSWHAEELKQAMVTGTFDGTVTDVTFCRCDGKYYLSNGQHTLGGIVKAGEYAKRTGKKYAGPEVMVRIIHCADLDEVQRHYANADIGIMRTHKDAIQASGLYAEYDLSPAVINKVTSAMAILIRGFAPRDGSSHFVEKSRPLREAMDREWLPFAVTYFAAVKTQKSLYRHFRKAPILAVGLVTVRYQEDKAVDFWAKVADDSGLTKKDPPKVLREKILELDGNDKVKTTQEYYSRLAAVAWNAFFEGRKIASLRVNMTNIKIVGTPYKGTRLVKPNISKLLGE